MVFGAEKYARRNSEVAFENSAIVDQGLYVPSN